MIVLIFLNYVKETLLCLHKSSITKVFHQGPICEADNEGSFNASLQVTEREREREKKRRDRDRQTEREREAMRNRETRYL